MDTYTDTQGHKHTRIYLTLKKFLAAEPWTNYNFINHPEVLNYNNYNSLHNDNTI